MKEFALIAAGIAGLLLVVALIALWPSRKTWPIYTILLVFANLMVACLFAFFAARNLGMQDVWRTEVKKWAKVVNEKNTELVKVEDGDPGNAEDPVAKVSAHDLRTALHAAESNRGRVWGITKSAGVQIRGSFDGQLQLKLTFEQREQGTGPKMEAGILLNAFAIQGIEDKASYQYLGYFRLDGATDEKSTTATLTRLEATLPEEQIQAVNNVPIVLYENYPTDSHTYFAERSAEDIQKLFRGVSAETLNQFLQDGKAASEAQLKFPERIWWRVKFTRDIDRDELSKSFPAGKVVPKPVAVDNPENVVQTEHFKENQVVLFDQESAEVLMKNKIVAPADKDEEGKVVGYKIYRRPLRDYMTYMRQYRKMYGDLQLDLLGIGINVGRQGETQKSIQASIAGHAANTKDIEADLESLKKERELMDKHAAEVAAEIKTLQEAKAKLEQDIARDAAEIERIQLEAAKKINAQP